MSDRVFRVAVVGGGVAGLACAHRLLEISREEKRPLEVRLFEAAPQVGGVIATHAGNGYLWEDGPDSFLTEKPTVLDLARRLDLSRTVIGTNPDLRKSFIYSRGRLHPTPGGFYLMAPTDLMAILHTSLLSPWGKIRALLEPLLPRRPAEAGDESLGHFVRRRFGAEVLARLAQPLVAGIYGADPDRLSLRATFPRFLDHEARYGSVIRGLRRIQKEGDPAGAGKGANGPRYGLFATFRKGMQSLVEGLVHALPPQTALLGAPVSAMAYSAPGWTLTYAGTYTYLADAVCLALPAPLAAPLLHPWDSSVADHLASIPYTPAAALNLVYSHYNIAHPMDGFGFVVPAQEKKLLTGCTFAHVKFPDRAPTGRVLLRAFAAGPALSAMSNEDIEKRLRSDLIAILGTRSTPVWSALKRHSPGLPHYQVGHLDLIRAIRYRLKTMDIHWKSNGSGRLALAGASYDGIGIPDCVKSGEDAAVQLAQCLWNGKSA
jgi:oxygen-dependent protoporphyrinogen oxidase